MSLDPTPSLDQARRPLLWVTAAAWLLSADVLWADLLLSTDAEGSVGFRTSKNIPLEVAANGDMPIDGRVLADGRERLAGSALSRGTAA